MSTIKVALVGLGQVGEVFAENFLEKIQESKLPIEIVAVADRHPDSPIALGFSQNKVPVFTDALDVVKMGDKVDIIFDLTGNSTVRQGMRLRLMESKNHHTMLAPEIFAQLMWFFFNTSSDMPKSKGGSTGY